MYSSYVKRLRDENESYMVRHECAEALGSIANDQVFYFEFDPQSEPILVIID